MVLVVFALVSVVAMAFAPTGLAYTGGVETANLRYDCGGSCHTTPSASTVEMWASCLYPEPDEVVTVCVNVTGAEAIGGRLGVMLVASMDPDRSMPSADNWTIISDPSGITSFNYYQIEIYTGEASLEWVLRAPSTTGMHILYAREMHGTGGLYSNDYAAGIVFTIGETTEHECTPSVFVTSPTGGDKVYGDVTVCANIQSTQQLRYCLLKIDGQLVENVTDGPYAWTIDTTSMEDGTHVVNVTAVDADGHTGSFEFVIEVNNEGEHALFISWIATMASGSLLLAAVSGLAIMGALYYRSRGCCRKVR